MAHRRNNKANICLLLISLLSLMSCSEWLFTTPIGKIQASPREYDGKKITVKGTVTESANLIFTKILSYGMVQGK